MAQPTYQGIPTSFFMMFSQQVISGVLFAGLVVMSHLCGRPYAPRRLTSRLYCIAVVCFSTAVVSQSCAASDKVEEVEKRMKEAKDAGLETAETWLLPTGPDSWKVAADRLKELQEERDARESMSANMKKQMEALMTAVDIPAMQALILHSKNLGIEADVVGQLMERAETLQKQLPHQRQLQTCIASTDPEAVKKIIAEAKEAKLDTAETWLYPDGAKYYARATARLAQLEEEPRMKCKTLADLAWTAYTAFPYMVAWWFFKLLLFFVCIALLSILWSKRGSKAQQELITSTILTLSIVNIMALVGIIFTFICAGNGNHLFARLLSLFVLASTIGVISGLFFFMTWTCVMRWAIGPIEACIRQSMREAGLTARQICVAECHGGTAVGDPIEADCIVWRGG